MNVGDRMKREGLVHDGVEIRFNGRGHRIDFKELTGRSITIYAQQEVVKDLIAARVEAGGETFSSRPDVSVHDFDSTAPTIPFQNSGEPSKFLSISLPAVTDFTAYAVPASRSLNLSRAGISVRLAGHTGRGTAVLRRTDLLLP